MILNVARNYSLTAHSTTENDDVTIEQVSGGCCDSMALSDIFPIFIVAGALWILVYCILMTQKIFMDSQYQEIQPKPRGEDDEEVHCHPPPSPRHGNNHVENNKSVENENHKHDHNERTFFAYYL